MAWIPNRTYSEVDEKVTDDELEYITFKVWAIVDRKGIGLDGVTRNLGSSL